MKYINDEKGFTLVELLIALAILAVGLLGLAGMQVSAMTGNKSANRLSAMTAVAQMAMEDLMAKPIDDPIYSASATGQTYTLTSTASNMPAVGTMSATYSVALDTPVTNVTRIIVTVTVGTRSLSMISYKRTA